MFLRLGDGEEPTRKEIPLGRAGNGRPAVSHVESQGQPLEGRRGGASSGQLQGPLGGLL